MWYHATGFPALDLWRCGVGLVENETLLQPSPKDPELGYHPCVSLHQQKIFQLPVSCEKLMPVSCTSKLLARTCEFPKCIRFHLMLIWNPRGLVQNQNLETILINIVVLYFPHDNIVCTHMYNECKKSFDSGVCHKLWSIL